jgi:hypothetical protein
MLGLGLDLWVDVVGRSAGGGDSVASATIMLSNRTTPEGAIGSYVATLSVVNGSGTYTFTITSDPDSKFDIQNDDELFNDAALDFETAESHLVTISADNGVDDPISRQFTITVTDAEEVVPAIVLDTNTVAEDAEVDAAVGTASIDEAVTGTPEWSLVDDAAGQFQINSSTGAITVAGAITGNSDTIEVAVTGVTPSVDNEIFTINTILAAPVLDLLAESDTGSSDTDNISTDTTPTFTVAFSDLTAADHTIRVFDDAELVATHVLTAGEVISGNVNLELPVMTAGTHPIMVTADNGNGQSPVSNEISYVLDLTAPVTPTLSPLDNATDVALDAAITVTFAENIAFGSSVTIGIYETDDTPVVEYTEIDIDAGIAISGAVLTITNPGLTAGTGHYIQIASGSITDIAGNAYAGITDETSWSFTAIAASAGLVVEAATSDGDADNDNSIVVNLPAGIQANDLLIVATKTSSGAVTCTEPATWSTLVNATGGLAVFWKVASGGEGTTLTIGGDGNMRMSTVAFRISGASGNIEGSGSPSWGTTNDPASITPTWGSKETLFVAISSVNTTDDPFTAAPTNYTGFVQGQTAAASASTAHNQIAGAYRLLTATSDDPGTFTGGAGSATVFRTITIAVEPA